MTPLEFYRMKLGPNWVVARRTPNIIRRYGEDVVCVSQQRLREIDKEYRTLHGDPYDSVRAAMYLALLDARTVITERIAPDYRCLLERINHVIEAERNAR